MLRRVLKERPYITALFWDQATLYQPPRTKEEDEAFGRALTVMMDLYASAVGTTVLQIKEIPPRPTTYDGLLKYLCRKAPGRIAVATLPFEGKNQVVYSLPARAPMAPQTEHAEAEAEAEAGTAPSDGSLCVPCD